MRGCGFYTAPAIAKLLRERNAIQVEKETKSIYKGNIAEIHLVGIDTYDCVLASAYESFDLGFFAYVLEECCQVAPSEDRHQDALDSCDT